MDSSTLKTRLETATISFQNLELQLADPDVASDPKRLENIARKGTTRAVGLGLSDIANC